MHCTSSDPTGPCHSMWWRTVPSPYQHNATMTTAAKEESSEMSPVAVNASAQRRHMSPVSSVQ